MSNEQQANCPYVHVDFCNKCGWHAVTPPPASELPTYAVQSKSRLKAQAVMRGEEIPGGFVPASDLTAKDQKIQELREYFATDEKLNADLREALTALKAENTRLKALEATLDSLEDKAHALYSPLDYRPSAYELVTNLVDEAPAMKREIDQLTASLSGVQGALSDAGNVLANRTDGDYGASVRELVGERDRLTEENDKLRTQITALLWSPAADNLKCGDIREWCDEYADERKQLTERVKELERERDGLVSILSQHHEWRLKLGTVQIPYQSTSGAGFGMGGHVAHTPVDMSVQYQESTLFNVTRATLEQQLAKGGA